VVDTLSPVITNVNVTEKTNEYAKITWDTDEPSTSKVYYGETVSLEKGFVEISALMVDHAVDLTGLNVSTLYYFDVESTDMLGHTTRDDNGGLHYNFTSADWGDILVVFGDHTFDREDLYRNTLGASMWDHNEWHTTSRGDPPLSILQEYKVVMWQPGYMQYPPLTDSQRALITSYLDNGGRFFISSNDVAWSLGDPSSPFYTVERSDWLKATLKADWYEDPSWDDIEGVSGNLISGDYTIPDHAPYTPYGIPHAGDEVYCVDAGGLCEYTWYSLISIWNPWPGPVAIQWNSSAANGTSGIGVWGGEPSRVVAYFFEFTRIDAANDNSPIRNDILNKTIKWLLRDDPIVEMISPNGGETFDQDEIIVSWSAIPLGARMYNQSLYYSNNSGLSWIHLTDPDPSDLNYTWNITTIPNDIEYMVKIFVQDDGDPKLNNTDESDGTFAIKRIGGDKQGPVTIPGSIDISPNPPMLGAMVWFNATVDDTDMGNATIASAEYFIRLVEPDVAEYGTGIPMTAVDGTFDDPLENVTWSGPLIFTDGLFRIWIHGNDSVGNWGPFENMEFLILTDLEPPRNLSIALEGSNFENINLSWDASLDDPLNVEYYDIYCSEVYTPRGMVYNLLTSVPATGAFDYYYMDALKGNDTKNYFYYVSARAPAGYYTSIGQVAKFTRPLAEGMNLVSVPLIMEDESIATVLQTAAGDFDLVWYYDAADMLDPWKCYNVLRSFNELTTVNRTMALWINATADSNLTVVGTVPTTTSINLIAGWNFVGFPSLTERTIDDALSGVNYERIQGYSQVSPHHVRDYSGNDFMIPGYGYWIKVGSDVTWIIAN
jgi:hypothetical protein